jgi:hypothetical protein
MYDPILRVWLASLAFLLAAGDPQHQADRPGNPLAALAGEYYFSDGFERESLKISPKGRFELEYDNCTGGFRISGRAKFVDGHLALGSDLVYRIFFVKVPTDLIPIRWGDRLYLVPKGAGDVFCNHVNLMGPSGHPGGTFYLRRGDDEKRVDGLPSVPKAWEHMLLPSPLNGKIVEVMKPGRARVDFGSDSGAWKGMALWVNGEGSPWVETVVEVHATNCVIESNHPATVFKIGDRVSSKRSIDD